MLEFVDIKVADRIDSLMLQVKIGSFEVAHWIELRKVAELMMMMMSSDVWKLAFRWILFSMFLPC